MSFVEVERMGPDLKQFVKAVREKDVRKVREQLEVIEQKLDLKDEFWAGYHLALRGMVAAIESGDELTAVAQIASGKHSREFAQKLFQQIQEQASQSFRPKDEQGFDTAWIDVLKFLVG